MARLPRLDIPGVPQHVVQRGHNRLPCFLDDIDRHHYKKLLAKYATRMDCAIHSYVLMSNHVHLLVTASEPHGVSRMMQGLGRNFAGYFNLKYERTGALFEGRFRSCLVDSEAYVLECYRYIELNPVRGRIVASPDAYRWSSYAHNALGYTDPLITPHDCYLRLGESDVSRRHRFEALVAQGLPAHVVEEIQAYLRQQRALGGDAFRSMVEQKTQRFAGVRPPHRPHK